MRASGRDPAGCWRFCRAVARFFAEAASATGPPVPCPSPASMRQWMLWLVEEHLLPAADTDTMSERVSKDR